MLEFGTYTVTQRGPTGERTYQVVGFCKSETLYSPNDNDETVSEMDYFAIAEPSGLRGYINKANRFLRRPESYVLVALTGIWADESIAAYGAQLDARWNHRHV